MTISLTQTLVQQLLERDITNDDRNRAADHLVDWLACSVMGQQSSVGNIFIELAKTEKNATSSLTIPFVGKSHWRSAISCNGALGNVLEMDDIHRSSILHPGPIVIPAALAIAEQQNLPVSKLLDAIVLGYEVTIRIGEAIGRSHYKYFHNTSSCAAFGAAMSAGYLLGLTQSQLVDALGNVGSKTGGLWQMRNEAVYTKQWHNSEACQSGVMAAKYAHQGLTGPKFILEGPQGVFNAMSEDATPDKVVDNSQPWRMYDCSFKPWPACRHAHPAIDVCQQWLATHELALEQIQHIEIKTYKDAAVFCDRVNPKTEAQAKFSIQHAVAAQLIWGEPELTHYQANKLDGKHLVAIRDKVSVSLCEQAESRYPQHYGASIVITDIHGKQSQVSSIDTLGDPERPMSKQALADKTLMLFGSANLATQGKTLLSKDWLALTTSEFCQIYLAGAE